MAATALKQTSFLTQDEPSQPLDIGFKLGWDYAHYGAVPPAAHLDPLGPVRQGWDAGRQIFAQRTLASNRFVREWLQLRLTAWMSGRAFEETQVNPAYLRQIDVAICPITREVLTHGTGELSDASVDRVFNDAAYAGGNLAVMSTRANRVKNDYGSDDAMRFARQIELGQLDLIGGLTAEQWARIAILTSFVTPMPHAMAATLPLLVLPPNRLRVLNPVQSLQVMLSLQCTRPGHARRCAALASLMPSADVRDAFNPFMLTLLARRVEAGRSMSDVDERRVIEDMWLDPLVQRRWRRLASRLTEADCSRIVRLAVERGLADSGIRWARVEAAIEEWSLESAGYATAEVGRVPSRRRAQSFLASNSLSAQRPGVLRLARCNLQLPLAMEHR